MSKKYDLKKIAQLSQLEYTEEELKELEPIVHQIIGYFDLLSGVQIDEKEQIEEKVNQVVFHEDQQENIEIAPDSFSPYVEEHYFKTPKIIE